MLSMLSQMGVVAVLGLLIAVVPAFMGAAYAVRPTEAKLALMRPLSLASIFAALCGWLSGIVNVLRAVGMEQAQFTSPVVALGLAEALVPMFVAFGCLTIAWLAVALGLRRQG